jgi:tagatose 1,6-diphosphate aldolase
MTSASAARFTFLDPGELRDQELSLVLGERRRPDGGITEVPTYCFHLMVLGLAIPVGHLNLRIGDTPNLVLYQGHIGYGVQSPWRGRRYAARATRLVIPLARQHGLETIWITCDPDNEPSRRTCEIVGAQWVETLDVPKDALAYRHGARRKCRYSLATG